jgi:hypothetical protein
MILMPLLVIEELTISKFKQLPLSYLKGISIWKNLKTLILHEVDLVFEEDDFNTFIGEISNSTIENIKIPGTESLLYLEDESKELQDYLPNKKVTFQY